MGREDEGSFWPEEYYAEGTFPADELQKARRRR